jgi:hypothetical protein
MMATVDIKALQLVTVKVTLPRLWKPRLWLCARLMIFAAWIAGMACTVDVVGKDDASGQSQ